jgi:predicted ester cyclase
MFSEDVDSRIEPSRRKLLLAAAALTPAVAAVGPGMAMAQADEERERLIGRGASAVQGKNPDNFAFGRTDENDLRADDPSLPRRARELIRIGNIGIVKGDLAAMAAFFHPQFRFHGPGNAELNREQLWDYFASCRAAFDDFSVTRQALVSDGGDYIASRTRFAGVFARTFTGAPEGPIEPNGKRFEYRVMNIFRYAPNGQLVEEWVQYDRSDFLAQLRSKTQSEVL